MSSLHEDRPEVHSEPVAPWVATWCADENARSDARDAAFEGWLGEQISASDPDGSLPGDSTPEVDGVILTLEDWLGEQASYYRSVGSLAAKWLASELLTLASEAKALQALTCGDYEARWEIQDAAHAEDLEYHGYQRGKAEARESMACGVPI